MSPLEREYLAALEPELRRQTAREAYPPRALSRPLVILMSALRLYVVACLGLVLVTFIRVLHH